MSLIVSVLPEAMYSIVTFELVNRQLVSRTNDGRLFTKNVGPNYWTGDFKTVPYDLNESFEIMSALDYLKENHCEFYDPSNTGLKSKDDFADNVLTVHTIASDRQSFVISGSASNITFTAGDYLSIKTGSKKQLVRVRDNVTKGSGNATINIVPALRNNVVATNQVSCRKPKALFQLVPGSVKRSIQEMTKAVRISFQLVEYL